MKMKKEKDIIAFSKNNFGFEQFITDLEMIENTLKE
jgi:hypothetical protein